MAEKPRQHSHSHNHDHEHGPGCGSGHHHPVHQEGGGSESSASGSADAVKFANAKSSTFSVVGMDCADEIAAIQKSLKRPGVGRIVANLMSSQVHVEHDASVSTQELTKWINSSGVRVRQRLSGFSFYSDNRSRVWLVGLSGLGLGFGILLNWLPIVPPSVAFSLFLLSALSGSTLIAPKALRALKQKSLDMNVLMMLAVIGAFFIEEFSEGAAVVFLFSLAELLEAFSVSRARKAIREVLTITPQIATVEQTETASISVPVEQVEIGQTIVVLAGDRIPLDGVVIKGFSTVNQGPLTGESTPVEIQAGDVVLAGTINQTGSLRIKVTHLFKDSKISNVVRLIEEAQSKKAPVQRFVDKFARIYTPAVTLVAVLVAVVPPLIWNAEWGLWFYRSLVFLVIACPCALVIATPIAIVSSLTALARAGVLVKGGAFLEVLGKLRAVAIDKTGTITEGAPKVVSIKSFNQVSEIELLKIVNSLESESNHPLSRAVVDYCEARNVPTQVVEEFKLVQGKGIEALIGEHYYFAGNHKMAHEFGVCSTEVESYLSQIENQAQSVLVVGHRPHRDCDGEIMGVLGVADQPRHNVQRVLQSVREQGVTKITILSGDNQRTVSAIAKQVGVTDAKGDLLPEDKVAEVRKLLAEYQYVGMIGDGINDAPALAQATVGIAMGAAGTDTAIETADVALMADDLGQLPGAIQHCRRTLNIIRINIGFALLVKAVFLALGAIGYSSLWLAVAADMGATLLVIANSLRLLRFDYDKQIIA